MATELELCARAERQYVRDEIRWFRAGAKLISPSGDDITAMKLTELGGRLEHLKKVLDDS